MISAVVIFAIFKPRAFNKNSSPSLTIEQTSLTSQTNSEGSVTVEVTPRDISQNSTSWDFEIVLNTHSGTLDQDLTKSSILIDDKGNQLIPISWEGDAPQGHHRKGILKFKPISPTPKFIQLNINWIGDVDDRIFKWELE